MEEIPQPYNNENDNVSFYCCTNKGNVKYSPKKEQSAKVLPDHHIVDYSSSFASDEERSKDLAHNSMFLQTLNLKSKGMSDSFNTLNKGESGIADTNHGYKQETVATIFDSSTSFETYDYNTNMPQPVETDQDSIHPNFLIPNPPETCSEFKSNIPNESDADNQNSLGKTLATSLHLIAATDAHTSPPPVESFLPDSVGMDELRSSTSINVPSVLNSSDPVTSTTTETENTPPFIRYRTRSIAVSEKNGSLKDALPSQDGPCKETKEEPITSTDDEPFHRCDQCGKVFHKKQTLRQHFITHTDRFACTFCNVRCKSKGDLRSHTQTHTKEKPFHCEVCNTYYTRESILRKHKTTQIHKSACIKAERMRLLQSRAKKLATDHSLQGHETNGSKKGKRTCNQCARVCSSLKEFRRHAKVHGFSFVCSKCQKKCKSVELLNIHERCHTRPTTLVCGFCSRLFSSTAVLKEHTKSHYRRRCRYFKRHEKSLTPQKKPSTHAAFGKNASSDQKTQTSRSGKKSKKQEVLFCHMCPRQFKSPKAFEKHCAKHLKQSPAPEQLKTEEKLKREDESTNDDRDHGNEGPELYYCADCAITFDSLESLKSHRSDIHNLQTMACHICYREFEDSTEYKDHVQNHAPTMLFSGESLEDSGIPVMTRKLTKHLNLNSARTNTHVSADHNTKTIPKNNKISNNVKADSNDESDCDDIMDCYDFIRLSRAVTAESSHDEETDGRDTGDESSDDQLYKGIQTLLCLKAGGLGDEYDADICSTARFHFKDQSKIDYQAFLDSHTTQDKENHIYKCMPCNACFEENGQLIDHIRTHACDICFECFVDKECLLEHKSQHDLKEDFRFTHGFACLDEVSSTSEDEANDLFLDELESVLDCEAKSVPQIDLLHKFGHDEIVKANKRIFERYSCIDTPTNIYACTICKRKYARPTTLTRHFKTHVCHYCNKFFTDKSDLLEHKYKHRQKAALLKAEISGEQSAKLLNSPVVSKVNRELIKKFTFIDSSRNVNKCCLCDKSFVRKTVLTRHMKTHICSYCDKFFEDKYELAKHVGMHKIDARVSEDGAEGREYTDFDEEKPYSSRASLTDQLGTEEKVMALDATFSSSLPHFSSTFDNPSGDAHETLTFIEIPVSDNCGNTSNVGFTNSNEAVTSTYQIISDSIDAFKETAHESFIVDGSGCPADDSNKIITIAPNQMMAAESNQDRLNLFECTLCGKTFFKNGHLKSHMSTHTVRKPHVCHLCGKSFVRQGALKRHEKSHEVKRCKFCDTSFNYQFELDDHMQMHESYPFYK